VSHIKRSRAPESLPSHSAIGENFPYGFKGARSAPGSDHLRDWMHARTTHGRARASARELHACESKFPNRQRND